MRLPSGLGGKNHTHARTGMPKFLSFDLVPGLQLHRDYLLEFHDIGRELADTFC
jgi:hypothetical protein